jgi:hypothetical protein
MRLFKSVVAPLVGWPNSEELSGNVEGGLHEVGKVCFGTEASVDALAKNLKYTMDSRKAKHAAEVFTDAAGIARMMATRRGLPFDVQSLWAKSDSLSLPS